MSNEEMLQRADAEDIEITLIKSRLRWLGHVSRMDNNRPVKALMYGELDKGTRPIDRHCVTKTPVKVFLSREES